ncbi:MAG TPA: zinc metallopeptidase, partial [Candidatus Limnocylindria bacterium]
MFLDFGPYLLLVFIPSVILTGWAAWRVRSTYAKWSKVDSGIQLSAFDFARRLLDRQGLTDVKIEPVEGQLTDHYDPRGKVLRVSSTVAGQPQLAYSDRGGQMLGVPASTGLSVAAAAVIAHEVGHALQDRERDPWMAVRQTIVPAVQIGSGIGPWLIIAGVIFTLPGLAWVGLIAFGAAVLFTFVTLPV